MWTDARGSVITEFALVAPMMIALLLAITMTSITFFAQQGLETAVESASRQIMTGQAQKAGMTPAQFKTAACQSLPPFMSCANLMVDARTATSLDTVDSSAPTITFDNHGNISNSWTYSIGSAGSIVVLRLMYVWTLPVGPLGLTLNNISSTQRMLVATSVAKTEPY